VNHQINKNGIATVQFVVKSSKLCNLRCQYCYEYPELGNRNAISIEQLDRMYSHISEYYGNLERPVNIEFIWHGGEPLLQSPDYYWQTFDRQQSIFGNFAGSIKNKVQTNLTILNEDRLHLLRYGFDSVGVSLDLFGGLRTTQAGLDSQLRVLKNMDRLNERNIPFGCITVLTKLNLPYIREIFQFYERMKLSFRILPLFNGAFEDQHQGFEIEADEVLTAYCTLVDLWIESEKLVQVRPVQDLIQQVLHYYTPDVKPVIYDKRNWESIYLVNVTGDIYSYADAYNIDRCHGNIFTDSMEVIINSENHEKAIIAAEQRMKTCKMCKFSGSCSGYPVAEESVIYNQVDAHGNAKCIIEKGTLEYIERCLQQLQVIDSQARQISPIYKSNTSTAVAEHQVLTQAAATIIKYSGLKSPDFSG
jgi:uncharacterized protein